MPTKARFSFIDHSNEPTSFQVCFEDVDGTNYDNVVDNTATGKMGRVRIATAAITLCNETTQTFQSERYVTVNPSPPSDANAQRESGLTVYYVDSVTAKKFNLTIPAPDKVALAQQGTDIVDHVSNVLAAAWVTAFENDAVTPDGNAPIVTQMRLIGRNS